MKPPVVTWYKVYAGCMVLLYLVVLVAGIGLLFLPSLFPAELAKLELESEDETMMLIYGISCAVFGALLTIAYTVALFLPPKPWVWIYHIVLICVGLTGCPTLFASVPLLIFWLKPETAAYYGRGNSRPDGSPV